MDNFGVIRLRWTLSDSIRSRAGSRLLLPLTRLLSYIDVNRNRPCSSIVVFRTHKRGNFRFLLFRHSEWVLIFYLSIDVQVRVDIAIIRDHDSSLIEVSLEFLVQHSVRLDNRPKLFILTSLFLLIISLNDALLHFDVPPMQVICKPPDRRRVKIRE